MPKARLQFNKYVGATPTIATCSACGRRFTTPLTRLRKLADALASLQEQFERHVCPQGVARAADEGQ